MKKILLILVLTTLLSSCGVGTYSVASGNADESAVCFVANQKYDISVDIDGTDYNLKTIKQKEFKNRRNIKQTTQDKINLTPGRHKVIVTKDDKEVYNKEVFISATELKIIEL